MTKISDWTCAAAIVDAAHNNNIPIILNIPAILMLLIMQHWRTAASMQRFTRRSFAKVVQSAHRARANLRLSTAINSFSSLILSTAPHAPKTSAPTTTVPNSAAPLLHNA